MEKFAKWIVSHKKLLICIVILLIALSIIASIFVKKNGDVISYLDKNTEAILGKTLLENEFDISGDANIAVSYLEYSDLESITNRLSVSSKIRAATKKMVWAGTFDDLSQLDSLPGNNIPSNEIKQAQEKAKQKYIKTTEIEGKTVTTYIISIYFSMPNSEDAVIAALDEIDRIISANIQTKIDRGTIDSSIQSPSQSYYVGGNAQNARALIKSSLGDMPIFIVVAVVICFLILLATTKSYLEPILFLATLGFSILLNMGTNLIAGIPVGTISSITSSCAIILQLALAMDYSIFFMHTYYEEKKLTLDSKQAIVKALPKTIISISSSALTTVGGFVAMFFMKYKMGYDLGFVLAKGVLLSLVSVIFVQPLLIMLLDKPIEKCRHKWSVECRLRPVSKHITKPWLAIAIIFVCIGIAIPSAYYQSRVPLNYITMTEENANPNLSEQILNQSKNQVILLVPFNSNDIQQQYEFIEDLKNISYVRDPNGQLAVNQNGEYLKDDNLLNVTEVFSLFTVVDKSLYDHIENSRYKSIIYSQLHSSFISNLNSTDNKQQYMLYTIILDGEPENQISYNTVDYLKKLCSSYFGESTSHMTGLTIGAQDLNRVTPSDYILVNCLSAALIFLVLLLTFRKPLLSLMLLCVIEIGIFANLSLIIVLGNLLPSIFDVKINFLAYLIVSAIELGATVDYAIILTSKFHEEKKNGASGQVAIKNAIYRSAPSILTSASILIIICIAIRLLTSNMIVGQITELIARGAFFSLILVFSLLPALLSIGERIKRWYMIKRGKPDPDDGKDALCLCDLPYQKLLFKKKNKKAVDIEENLVLENSQSDISADEQRMSNNQKAEKLADCSKDNMDNVADNSQSLDNGINSNIESDATTENQLPSDNDNSKQALPNDNTIVKS